MIVKDREAPYGVSRSFLFRSNAVDFRIDVQITKKAWLSQPTERWNQGLDYAGVNFRQHLKIGYYPEIPVNSTYRRTGNTEKMANYHITEPGRVMEFGGNSYLKYLLMPAKTVENWRGKKEELVQTMTDGFKAGVKAFGN